MKKTASKAALWLLPIATLGLVASVTFATSPRDNDKKSDKPKAGKSVKFAHDNEIDAYLTSIRSFMLVPPRDGLFGARRIPTIHGTSRNIVPGYEPIAKLMETEYSFSSFVGGHMPEQYLATYRQGVKDGRILDKDIPLYRLTSVHRKMPTVQDRQPQAQQQSITPTPYENDFYKLTTEKAQGLLATCFKEGYDAYSDSFDIAGHKAWIMAKAVHASDKSCYSCHTDIKEGQPIGYVLAVLTQNTP